VLICGLVALMTGKTRTALHVALVFGAIGIAGGAMGLSKLPALLTGDPVDRPTAAIVQLILFFLSLAYVALGVRSFIRARRSNAPISAAS
jgi:hypothetical protein